MKIQKKIYTYFINLSLFKRLIIYFTFVGIIPFLIYGIISITFSFHTIEQSAIQFIISNLEQIRIRVDGLLYETNNTEEEISSDIFIQEAIKEYYKLDEYDKLKKELEVNKYLINDSQFRNYINTYYVISNYDGIFKSNFNTINNYELNKNKWYKEIINSKKNVWFTPHKGSLVSVTTEEDYISVGGTINDKTTNKVLGVVLIEIPVSTLEDMLSNSFGKNSYLVIVDQNNHIIASSYDINKIDESTVLSAIELTDLTIEPYLIDEVNNTIVLSQDFINNRWRLVGIVPSDTLLKNYSLSVYLLLASMILMLIIALFLSIVFTSAITKPIRKMMFLMKKVEAGDLDVKMEVYSEDEIGKLSRSFNIMITQVKNLMRHVYEDQQKLRKAELQVLQNQINPHFLYNTLDSIVWLARMKQTEKIENIVNAMTTLFRISLSKGKDIISIAEEIRYIENYMTIQKFRYRSQFDYTIEVSESIKKYFIPKLVIQPIVENSIYHGVKLLKKSGNIIIKGYEENDLIIFKIIDTGLGMKPEILEALNYSLKNIDNPKLDIYGTKNVHQRLQIFFGSKYGLHYDSKYKEGTTATIIIPKMAGGKNYEDAEDTNN